MTALERRKDCVDMQMMLELRCLNVFVSSWVLRFVQWRGGDQPPTNHHFLAGSPLTPDDLETCNGLSLTSTRARTPVCFHLMLRLMSRRGSVLDLHSKLRSDSRRFKQGRTSRYLFLVSNHVRCPVGWVGHPTPLLPFHPTASRCHSMPLHPFVPGPR